MYIKELLKKFKTERFRIILGFVILSFNIQLSAIWGFLYVYMRTYYFYHS